MTPAQCKMARAALTWSPADLARNAGVSPTLIHQFEASGPLSPETIGALRCAFEAEHVRFLMNGEFAGAVVPPKPVPGDDSATNPIVKMMIERAKG